MLLRDEYTLIPNKYFYKVFYITNKEATLRLFWVNIPMPTLMMCIYERLLFSTDSQDPHVSFIFQHTLLMLATKVSFSRTYLASCWFDVILIPPCKLSPSDTRSRVALPNRKDESKMSYS